MNVLGVILARAGSAGLKNKHLLPLLGRPVIAYTFDHARASKLLTRVVVSSDSPEVLRLAGGAGFETIVRPSGLATAEASVQDVMLHALAQVDAPRQDPSARPARLFRIRPTRLSDGDGRSGRDRSSARPLLGRGGAAVAAGPPGEDGVMIALNVGDKTIGATLPVLVIAE